MKERERVKQFDCLGKVPYYDRFDEMMPELTDLAPEPEFCLIDPVYVICLDREVAICAFRVVGRLYVYREQALGQLFDLQGYCPEFNSWVCFDTFACRGYAFDFLEMMSNCIRSCTLCYEKPVSRGFLDDIVYHVTSCITNDKKRLKKYISHCQEISG